MFMPHGGTRIRPIGSTPLLRDCSGALITSGLGLMERLIFLPTETE